MSATNGHAGVDLATLEAELDELEKRADAVKLLAERILAVAGVIGFGMIVVIFARGSASRWRPRSWSRRPFTGPWASAGSSS